MLRFHFTEADLRRVTLAPVPNALLEVALSVRYLRTRPTDRKWPRPELQSWRQMIAGGLRPRAGVLPHLDPPHGGIFDFFHHPFEPGLRTGIDLLHQTPVQELSDEIALLPEPIRSLPALRELSDGTGRSRNSLAHDTRRFFASSLAPLWTQVQAGAVADRALRAETLLRGGTDALLATLVPHWRWQPPTLHVPAPGAPRDVHLDGQGLMLVPAYFLQKPMFGRRPGGPMELLYPLHAGEPPTHAADALGPLLGRTRATVLAALRHPYSTTEVADRVGISLPTASQHTTILRNAGLIATTRTGMAVQHTLTPLGEALLHNDTTRH
ncbi:winged helix-turn-helix domain-containing protein [Streptomyces crystallinus]|uniref:Winged helix-turn-helix domain-containing protein n=1 Tax=Streptomyces crystallinus TaxID=68191 RepID=A0ABP3RL89_9ACTN